MNIEQDHSLDSNTLLKSICKYLYYEELNEEDGGVRKINLHEHSGQGTIEHKTFGNNFNVTNFDIYLQNDLKISIPSQDDDNLYFFYTLEGIAYHSFDNSERFRRIDELKTVAVASSRYSHNVIIIKKGVQFCCNLISIDKASYLNHFIGILKNGSERLNDLNTIFDMLKEHLFECNYDLSISKQLRLINNVKLSESISSYLQLQSRYQLILASHIEKLYDETYNEREIIGISRSDIKKIRTISNHIIDNPGLNHSQDKLCSQFFISQSKLQHGFKSVHKTTVSNFTRNVRLEKAEELLVKSDLNVSEIVYTVGFTSRSYFSKIFKMKYGCNPTAYKKSYKSNKPIMMQA